MFSSSTQFCEKGVCGKACEHGEQNEVVFHRPTPLHEYDRHRGDADGGDGGSAQKLGCGVLLGFDAGRKDKDSQQRTDERRHVQMKIHAQRKYGTRDAAGVTACL